MTISAAQLLVTVGANTLPARSQLMGLAGMLGSGGMLAAGATAAGAVMVGVGVLATKMAGDFQSGLTSLVTGAGESQKNLQMVHDGILKLSQDTGTSTKQLVDGMYMIESGGFHGAAGLAILKAAAEGAKVGSADLGTVADTVDTILKNYGEGGALSATQATNALITTVSNGKTHLEDLASSLAFVLPAGAAAGLGLKDVLGAMATMTSVGVPAAESATYLRQMIIALEAPSAGARNELEKIGITTKQLGVAMKQGLPNALQLIQDQLAKHGIKQGSADYVAALREISGGTRQMQGMLNLMGPHLKTFKDDVAKVGGAAGKTGDQVQGWALVQKNANQQLSRAKESVSAVLIQLGEHLLPVVTQVARFFADHLPGAIKTFQTSVGPVVKVVGDLIGNLTANKPLMDGLKDAFERLKPAIGPILTGLAILTAISFAPLALGIAAILGLVFVISHLGDVLGWLGNRLGDFFGTVGTFFGNVFGAIGAFFGNVFGAIGTFVGNVIGAFGDLQKNVQQKAHDLAFGVVTWLRQMVQNGVNAMIDFEKRLIQKAHDTAAGFIAALMGLPGKLLALGEQLMKSLAQGIKNAAGNVAGALKDVPVIGGIAGGLNNIIPHFASGGTMPYSGVALVGENGPERVQLPGGARVTPVAAGAGMGMGAAGGGGPLIIQLQVDGRRLAEVTVPHLHTVIRNATGTRRF